MPEYQFFLQSTPVCKDYLTNCQWNGYTIPCSKLFHLKSTDDGFCCSFNSVPSQLSFANVGTANENAETFSGLDELTEDQDSDYEHIVSALCPTTPLSTNDWSPVCQQILQKEDAGKNDFKNHEKTKHKIRNASGSGRKRGLRVNINPLPCGWFSTGSYHESRVSILL